MKTSVTSGKRNIKRGYIDKPCLSCSTPIKSKLLFFPSTFERIKFCSFSCKSNYQKGKTFSVKTRKKMSLSHMGNSSHKGRKFTIEHLQNMSKAFRGEKHWNWQGGKTAENHSRRNQLEYKMWRKAVFERDSFKCCINNADCVHEVQAHHILRFSEYPELRFDVGNGITLCKNHHPLKRSHEQELAPLFKSLIK